jgi:hypothetical protein
MLPPLNEHGYLPPGIHRATLDEVIARFGTSNPDRRAIGDSLRWLADSARQVGVERILVNGSFATAKRDPADVDVAVLVEHLGPSAIHELEMLLADTPYVDCKLANMEDYLWFATRLYASDRASIAKGLIEVLL